MQHPGPGEIHADDAALKWSPDGMHLTLTGKYDNSIDLYDVEGGTSSAILTGYSNWVPPATFTPNSKNVISGSVDGSVRCWGTASRSGRVLYQGNGWILAVAVSPCGRHVPSSSLDCKRLPANASDIQAVQKQNSFLPWVQTGCPTMSLANHSPFLSQADRGFFRTPIAVSFASRSRFLSRADRSFFPGRPQFLLQADRDNFKRPFAIVWRNESQLHFESNRRNGPTRGVARCERRAVELVSEIQFSACVRGNNGVLQVSEPGKRNTILTEMSVNAYGSG